MIAEREASRGHVPVMAVAVLRLLAPRSDYLLVDLTVGAGGHAGEFLAASAPAGQVIGCDRDPVALQHSQEHLAPFGKRVSLIRGDFLTVLERLAREGVRPDGIFADLGVSSMQLDDPERGFTLRHDELLGMTMDPDAAHSAAAFLNEATLSELVRAFEEWGEEPRGRRVAEAIVKRRRTRPFRTTGDLRCLVEDVLHRRGGRIHPATRVFQGLRIAVNDEMGQLEGMLPRALDLLGPGGRLVILSFHSGEDRRVKHALKAAAEAGRGVLLTRRPLVPERQEVRRNRRSRSARLRGFEVGQENTT